MRKIGWVAGLLLMAACTKPGPRAQGSAEVFLAGDTEATWVGPCLYRVLTRWASNVPHIIRLDDEASDRALVISGSRRWSEGRTDFRRQEEKGVLGLALEGATVMGGLQGSVHIEHSGDSMFVEVRGAISGRDPQTLRAVCRMGAVSP